MINIVVAIIMLVVAEVLSQHAAHNVGLPSWANAAVSVYAHTVKHRKANPGLGHSH